MNKPITALLAVLTVAGTVSLAAGCDPGTAGPEKSIQATEEQRVQPDPKLPSEPHYPDGDYIVGVDIPPGMYETEASPGFFDLCSITTDGKGNNGDGFGQWQTGNEGERVIINVTRADGLLSVDGCNPLRERE